MEPIRIEAGNVAVFTTDQIEMYGLPDDIQWPRFYVIESPPEMVMGFAHRDHTWTKKIHRYDRDSRFRTCLRNLMGDSRSKVDQLFVDVVSQYLGKDSKNPYEECRRIICHYNRPDHYRLIPTILINLGYEPVIERPADMDGVLRKVFLQYKRFETAYFRDTSERKYFPNMKYIALKLLEMNGVDCSKIKKLRTDRKLVKLEQLFDDIYYAEIERSILKGF